MLVPMTNVPLDQWTSTVVLGDGDTATIRPITPDDREALLAFHERQSSESKYRRFFSAKPSLSGAELDHFTHVDFVHRVALVVERHGEFIGWASYERWPNRDDAEAAFMVDDQHQGMGIATLQLEHLAAIARSNGIRRFTAEVLAENRAMLTVFSRAGWPLQRRFDSGVIDIDFDLEDTTEFINSVERREQRADSRAMARLLLPRSIAVIGATDRLHTVGFAVWRHVQHDFTGPVYAVNPHRDSVDGTPTSASVRDIGDEVSLAVIAVPVAQLESVIDDCIAARVRGAVVVTATDHSEVDMAALVTRARRNGLRIIGASSMGIASPRPDVAIQACLVHVDLPPGGVAISLQSGTLGGSLLRLAGELQLGISWFVSLGDKVDVSGNDLLQFWLDDEATKVVAMYTESFGNPRKFARIARRVSQTRPIVAVRTGAALIGPGTGALYQQAGLIEVPTVVALLDTARVMATQPLMTGPNVAVVTNSRSPGVLAEAALTTAGLQVVPPPHPIDWRATGPDYRDAIGAALADDEVHAVLVIHAPPTVSAVGAPVADIEAAAAGAGKPIVAVMLGATDGPLTPGSPIQAFAFPEPAGAVLGRLYSYWRWRTTEGESVVEAPEDLDTEAAAGLLQEALDEGTASLDLHAACQLLDTYGIRMSPAARVPITQAVAAADELGYPVAVKALRRRVGRSLQAGVALDLAHAVDVVEAVEAMVTHLGDDANEVMVQRMVPPGIDLRIHAAVDPRLGTVLTVGLGGAQADVIGDESSRLAPVSAESARSMLRSTRAGAAISHLDEDHVVDLLVRVGQLVSDHPEIAELDLNPVIVGTDSCWVTDAVVRVAPPAHPESAMRRLEADSS
jgi:acyl-CoA synthetase (NDP forming)/RimJ/RimL family protein N-acetyltransferase